LYQRKNRRQNSRACSIVSNRSGNSGRVQPLAAQQLADLARPRARVGLLQDPQLVFGAKRTPLGSLDQLGVRHPRRRGVPPCNESRLAYGSPVFAAGDTLAPVVVLDAQHRVVRSSLALDRLSDFKVKTVSPDADRKGRRAAGDSCFLAKEQSWRTAWDEPDRVLRRPGLVVSWFQMVDVIGSVVAA
jgi:hypothetical protein